MAEIVTRLPPMPENIEKLLLHLPSTSTSQAEIKRLIGSDPGLCAELLHLTNACYAGATPIETIDGAVDCAGVDPLIQLIGTSFVNGALHKEFAALTHLDHYFAHSREICATTRILARLADSPEQEQEMYRVAGLIHDIGRLIIMIAANKTSAPLLGTTWDQMTTIISTEQEALGMNHCDIGREVCRNWSFAPILQEGIQRHHSPLLQDDFSRPGAMIFLAHFVSGSDFTGEIIAKILPQTLFTRLGLTIAEFDEARRQYRHLSLAELTPGTETI